MLLMKSLNEFNKIKNRMDTIFRNSENSKTSDPHRLLLNISGKIHLKRSNIYVLYRILAYTIHGKKYKSHIKVINLKYQLPRGAKDLNYLMDLTFYQIFKIILNISLKDMKQ